MHTLLAVMFAVLTSVHSFASELRSPGRTFVISFQVLKRVKASVPARDMDDVNQIQYRISFTRISTSTEVTSALYTDVYDASPRSLEWITSQLTWSPKEDFVLLPPENWASAPGTESRQAVSLNPKHGWKPTRVTLEGLLWIDDQRVIGNRHQDCSSGVEEFNGRTGKTTVVMPPTSPTGYKLLSDRSPIVIVSMLDNCGTPKARASFKPQCFKVDPASLGAQPYPCP